MYSALVLQCPDDAVKNVIESLADILRQEPQHEVAVLLEQSVFSSIPAVGIWIGEMLCTIQFDGDARVRTQQINLHLAPPIENDRKLNVQAESARGSRQCLQPAE
jgi:hypothetical protein